MSSPGFLWRHYALGALIWVKDLLFFNGLGLGWGGGHPSFCFPEKGLDFLPGNAIFATQEER